MQDYTNRLIDEAELLHYMGGGADPTNLSDRISALLAQQYDKCLPMRSSHDQLSELQTKWFNIDCSRVIAQHNPKRIRNTASFDKASIQARPCFLDADNLLDGQMGVSSDQFIIFGNPFAIVEGHITIASNAHVDQVTEQMIIPGCNFSKRLERTHYVFYNGPETGASAPDHAHLQGGSNIFLPIKSDIERIGRGKAYWSGKHTKIYVPESLGRTVVVIDSISAEEVDASIRYIMSQLPKSKTGGEPLTNITFTYKEGLWTIYYSPRTNYRPHHFYNQDDSQILVGPAALEMDGILVLPRQEDFNKMTPKLIKEIFDDICVNRRDVVNIVRSMR